MNIFIEEEEIKEIRIEDILKPSNDRGVVHQKHQGESRGLERSDLEKEIIAHDVIETSGLSASKVHDITQQGANGYARGENLSDEARDRVIAHKYNVADIAISKLMDSLNLFDPNGLDSEMDRIKSASMLAGIVEKVTSKENGKGGNNVVLNLYAPQQRALSKYDVIEVSK